MGCPLGAPLLNPGLCDSGPADEKPLMTANPLVKGVTAAVCPSPTACPETSRALLPSPVPSRWSRTRAWPSRPVSSGSHSAVTASGAAQGDVTRRILLLSGGGGRYRGSWGSSQDTVYSEVPWSVTLIPSAALFALCRRSRRTTGSGEGPAALSCLPALTPAPDQAKLPQVPRNTPSPAFLPLLLPALDAFSGG